MAAMPGQGLIQVATKCKLFFALPEWVMDWPLSIHCVFGYASSSFPRTERIRVVPHEAGIVKSPVYALGHTIKLASFRFFLPTGSGLFVGHKPWARMS